LTLRVLRSRQKVLVTTLLDTGCYSRQAIAKLYSTPIFTGLLTVIFYPTL
jgi:hypothetical protein